MSENNENNKNECIIATSYPLLLFDCFLYNGEAIVKERLRIMAKHVDRIYVIESRYTLENVKKSKLNIDVHCALFTSYLDKIEFVIVESLPSTVSATNKEFLYMYMYRYLQEQLSLPYLAILGHVDEIVRSRTLKQIREPFMLTKLEASNQLVYFEMEYYKYNRKWRFPTPWCTAFLFSHTYKGNVASARTLGMQSKESQRISNAGRCLKYFMSSHDLLKKSQSRPNPKACREEWIYTCLATGCDLFDRISPPHTMKLTNDLFPIPLQNRHYMDLCMDRHWLYEECQDISMEQQLLSFACGLIQGIQNGGRYFLLDDFISPSSHGQVIPFEDIIDLKKTSDCLSRSFADAPPFRLLTQEMGRSKPSMEVTDAWYGDVNVCVEHVLFKRPWMNTIGTTIQIPPGQSFNHAFETDPCPGHIKTLYMFMEWQGVVFPVEISEQTTQARMLTIQSLIEQQYRQKAPDSHQRIIAVLKSNLNAQDVTTPNDIFLSNIPRILKCIQFTPIPHLSCISNILTLVYIPVDLDAKEKEDLVTVWASTSKLKYEMYRQKFLDGLKRYLQTYQDQLQKNNPHAQIPMLLFIGPTLSINPQHELIKYFHLDEKQLCVSTTYEQANICIQRMPQGKRICDMADIVSLQHQTTSIRLLTIGSSIQKDLHISFLKIVLDSCLHTTPIFIDPSTLIE
ncbi:MAG: hypothetical protein Sylvanvirus8_22 [Sylvanvirus sp.]|uniref:Uncharacterized protein n=1 Tax=Sylvanvirus sp. TaxID=2487774 RepID=A0A3G5AHX4_9VIRU|nr:MAG: hypothetical protein Sylvanvirus8_22 [Sylvanvirus sp.]